jgi:hypothetical protein
MLTTLIVCAFHDVYVTVKLIRSVVNVASLKNVIVFLRCWCLCNSKLPYYQGNWVYFQWYNLCFTGKNFCIKWIKRRLFQHFEKSDTSNSYLPKTSSPYSSGMWETQMFPKLLNWQCWASATAWPGRCDEDSLCAFGGNRTLTIGCAAYKASHSNKLYQWKFV